MKGMFDARPKNSENFHQILMKSLDDNKAKYDRALYSDWVLRVYAKCTDLCIKMDDFYSYDLSNRDEFGFKSE